jgi:MFS family permease
LTEGPSQQSQTELSDGSAQVRVGPFSSLSFPEFRLVFLSFLVGFVGFQARQVTNLWLIYEETQSALSLGLLGLFQFAPMLVLVFVGGSIADLVDKRVLLIVTQVGNFALAGVLAVLTLTGQIEVWHIYGTTLLTASINTFEGPARMAMLPRLVPRTHLLNAITLNQAGRHAGMLIGPALAGALIGLVGPGTTYALVGVVALPSVGALFLLRPMPPDPNARRHGVGGRAMLEGFRFVFSTNAILALLLLDVVAMLFTHHRILVPIFAEDILGVGEFGFGLLMSAPAAGFLIGSTLLLFMGNIKRKGLIVLVTYGLYMVAIALFAVSRSFWLSFVALVAVGGLDGVGAIMRSTVLQSAVPDEIRGRATAVLQLSNRGGPSLGQVLLGAMAASITAPSALVVGAAVGVVTLVLVIVFVRGVVSYKG